MKTDIRGALLTAALLAAMATSAAALADPLYFHNGRSAPPDFSDVNAYEQASAQAARAQGGAGEPAPEIAYNTRGRSAKPDFGPVNAYIASNGVAPDGNQWLAGNTRGRNATPDFGPVRLLEAGQTTTAREPLVAMLQPGAGRIAQ